MAHTKLSIRSNPKSEVQRPIAKLMHTAELKAQKAARTAAKAARTAAKIKATEDKVKKKGLTHKSQDFQKLFQAL